MAFQVVTAQPSVDPRLSANSGELYVSNSGSAGAASFEKESSSIKGMGGYLRDNGSGYGFHITGTDEPAWMVLEPRRRGRSFVMTAWSVPRVSAGLRCRMFWKSGSG